MRILIGFLMFALGIHALGQMFVQGNSLLMLVFCLLVGFFLIGFSIEIIAGEE